ncbi:hypothetical protein CPB83DRAFT_863826, partial [Crepidotus variabilis]
PKIETGSSGWLRQEEAVKNRSPLMRVILDLWPTISDQEFETLREFEIRP